LQGLKGQAVIYAYQGYQGSGSGSGSFLGQAVQTSSFNDRFPHFKGQAVERFNDCFPHFKGRPFVLKFSSKTFSQRSLSTNVCISILKDFFSMVRQYKRPRLMTIQNSHGNESLIKINLIPNIKHLIYANQLININQERVKAGQARA
jgi:hypothetical protein